MISLLIGRFDLVDTLLKNGANVSITDQNNHTALYEAVTKGEYVINEKEGEIRLNECSVVYFILQWEKLIVKKDS